MKRVPLDEAKPGMVLAKPVTSKAILQALSRLPLGTTPARRRGARKAT